MWHAALKARCRRGHGATATAVTLAAVLSAGLVALGSIDGAAADPVERPAAADASTRVAPAAPGSPAPSPPQTFPASTPTRITIPALDVDAGVMELGLHADGTMEVPPHAPFATSRAGWYRHSPTPGELGPAVIVGHVDSDRHGPSVFYGLDRLKRGDTIDVGRTDGSAVTFTVERIAQYGKESFPVDEVYGNIDHAGLRLITCGGEFDRARMQYEDNIVVYASLTSTP